MLTRALTCDEGSTVGDDVTAHGLTRSELVASLYAHAVARGRGKSRDGELPALEGALVQRHPAAAVGSVA